MSSSEIEAVPSAHTLRQSPMTLHDNVISVRGGCVTFDGDCVVDEVDFQVAPGEFVAVLGENGAGKTTLMRAILGLVPLSSGTIDLFGTPLPSFREWQRIGYVPQRLSSTGAVPVSVREVVESARFGPSRRWKRHTQEDRKAIDAALEHVGLSARAGDRFDALSGGQQRRTLIARALATGADLMVLDEPTAGIDAESQQTLAGTLKSVRAQGTTVLLVTHELGFAAELTTRVLLLGRHVHGSIRYDGPPRDDLSGPVHHHHDDHPAPTGPYVAAPGVDTP